MFALLIIWSFLSWKLHAFLTFFFKRAMAFVLFPSSSFFVCYFLSFFSSQLNWFFFSCVCVSVDGEQSSKQSKAIGIEILITTKSDLWTYGLVHSIEIYYRILLYNPYFRIIMMKMTMMMWKFSWLAIKQHEKRTWWEQQSKDPISSPLKQQQQHTYTHKWFFIV